ncbi:uncharacterized protein METZ01_LOCUS268560 [marine metagenome]|uniref:ABC transporter substrate-binding protein PnrA-like domain-containing protein n=1 Tax=marine metagenome TaxID=408172 RepID=A0A382JVC5_9ZZZZ
MKYLIKGLLAVVVASAMSSVSLAAVTLDGDPKVAFLYYSPKNDGGWSQAHERGRQQTAEALGMDLAYVENVAETNEAVRQVVDLYIGRGYNIIIGTSYGYGDGLKEASEANPNVAFVNVAGETASENLETMYARTYEAWYLAGMAAGGVSKSNKIGIIAGFPVSVVNWDVNAFARGAQSVNPDVEVIATYANSWWDPVKEKQIAEAMLDAGADVIAQNMSTTGPLVSAEAVGAYSIGFQNDMSFAAPNGHLTSVIFNWGNYFTPLIQAVAAGNWTSKGLPLIGFAGGVLSDITPLNSAVPAELQQKIAEVRESMINGSFHPFTGPVRKQNGEVVVPAGEVIDDNGLWSMVYFVEGIIGTMPE